jgi:hypothetical protein
MTCELQTAASKSIDEEHICLIKRTDELMGVHGRKDERTKEGTIKETDECTKEQIDEEIMH